jgi:hypothetical protein
MHVGVVGCVPVEGAVVLLIGVENSSWDYLEVIECFRKGRCSVEIPVCAAITNHHTSKVNVVQFWLESSLHVVLVDLPSEVGDVDTGVTFSRDEEFVLQVFWELGVP